MIRILCSADIHLGRRSTRIPEDVLAGEKLSAASAWERIVDLALAEDVQAIALTGDIVDQENRFYESVGPLERGLRRLSEAGIDTFAVSGNHDFEVLPRVARSLRSERFHLLGRKGKWERVSLIRDGKAILHFDGWSFPEARVESSPISEYSLPEDFEVPVVALLHADLDQPASLYAPVQKTELQSHPLSAWLLGHIHRPLWQGPESGVPFLYPGSPQALDPGETGVHGAWVLELNGRQVVAARPVPVSSVCYQELDLELGEQMNQGDFESRLTAALQMRLRECLAQHGAALQALALRVRLQGRTRLHRFLCEEAGRIPELRFNEQNATVFPESVEMETRPALDLQSLARVQDPPGVLARWILDLDQCDSPASAGGLLSLATEKARQVYEQTPYHALSDLQVPESEEIRQRLTRQAYRLLEHLIQQRETS